MREKSQFSCRHRSVLVLSRAPHLPLSQQTQSLLVLAIPKGIQQLFGVGFVLHESSQVRPVDDLALESGSRVYR